MTKHIITQSLALVRCATFINVLEDEFHFCHVCHAYISKMQTNPTVSLETVSHIFPQITTFVSMLHAITVKFWFGVHINTAPIVNLPTYITAQTSMNWGYV